MSPPDSAADPLEELVALFNRARCLAQEVGRLLEAGQSGEALTERLKEQADAMARFQVLLGDFKPERSLRTRSEIRRCIQRMRSEFGDLVKTTEANLRLASRKGVRLAGLGGKPHVFPTHPAAGRAPSDG